MGFWRSALEKLVNLKEGFWVDKKVLITGHTGFKGSWLSLWLCLLGAKVYGFSLKPETQPSLFKQLSLDKKIEDHRIADITNFQAISSYVKEVEPEIVFHMAAQPLVRESYIKPLLTWQVNVQGSLNLLESLKTINQTCSVVVVTTDKVYKNIGSDKGYEETDRLGGHDPYSSSKAALELAISSWRASFCGNKVHQNKYLAIATARAGNVIGGGDWALDRLFPDAVRALSKKKKIIVRNPDYNRPWQHVLEPLSGYLVLGRKLFEEKAALSNEISNYTDSFNFGPDMESNKTVKEVIEKIIMHWKGSWTRDSDINAFHEAEKLNLNINKAKTLLKWHPKWDFDYTIKKTVNWYYEDYENKVSPFKLCLQDIIEYSDLDIKKFHYLGI